MRIVNLRAGPRGGGVEPPGPRGVREAREARMQALPIEAEAAQSLRLAFGNAAAPGLEATRPRGD